MTNPTVVITAAVTWEGTTARPQHFARGLAQLGWNVLYVDAPITWLSPMKNPKLRSKLLPAVRLRPISVPGAQGDVRVLYPVAGMPFGSIYRAVNAMNQRLLAYQIQSAVPGPYILFPMLPQSVDIIPYLRPMATVYDCVDFHTEFGGLMAREVVDRMERELVYGSRVVFATADKLKARMERWHSDVRLLQNAAQVEHFQASTTVNAHERLASIPGPRVGFIGGIGSWVDLEFISSLATARPDVQFVMIGPIETDVSSLQRLQNVHLLGLQPYAELPRFLAGFDATLVVFRQNELAQAVNPIKVYEYLAAGKEVIATPIHELRKMEDLIWIAEDTQAGVSALNRVLAGERRTDTHRRDAFVAGNSWNARVSQVHDVLRTLVPDLE